MLFNRKSKTLNESLKGILETEIGTPDESKLKVLVNYVSKPNSSMDKVVEPLLKNFTSVKDGLTKLEKLTEEDLKNLLKLYFHSLYLVHHLGQRKYEFLQIFAKSIERLQFNARFVSLKRIDTRLLLLIMHYSEFIIQILKIHFTFDIEIYSSKDGNGIQKNEQADKCIYIQCQLNGLLQCISSLLTFLKVINKSEFYHLIDSVSMDYLKILQTFTAVDKIYLQNESFINDVNLVNFSKEEHDKMLQISEDMKVKLPCSYLSKYCNKETEYFLTSTHEINRILERYVKKFVNPTIKNELFNSLSEVRFLQISDQGTDANVLSDLTAQEEIYQCNSKYMEFKNQNSLNSSSVSSLSSCTRAPIFNQHDSKEDDYHYVQDVYDNFEQEIQFNTNKTSSDLNYKDIRDKLPNKEISASSGHMNLERMVSKNNATLKNFSKMNRQASVDDLPQMNHLSSMRMGKSIRQNKIAEDNLYSVPENIFAEVSEDLCEKRNPSNDFQKQKNSPRLANFADRELRTTLSYKPDRSIRRTMTMNTLRNGL